MSAFKKLSKSDFFIVPYYANKYYSFGSGSVYPSLYNTSSYKVFIGQNLTGSLNLNSSPTTSLGEYKQLVYSSINHLFYQNYSSSLLNTHSLASSLYYESASSYRPTSSYFVYNENPGLVRNFPTGFNSTIEVLSIPKDFYGTKIKEGTFFYETKTFTLNDDGKGNIRWLNNEYIGNIFYAHGIIVITHPDYIGIFGDWDSRVSFENVHPIYEQVIKCSVKEFEMNCSYNPSLKKYKSSESSSIHDFATGSLFQPYVTTIGLYNDTNDLLMVAKMAKPIPLSQYTDTNIIVKIDV